MYMYSMVRCNEIDRIELQWLGCDEYFPLSYYNSIVTDTSSDRVTQSMFMNFDRPPFRLFPDPP